MGDTDATGEASTSTAPKPPKKRSFFKKPSWQSEPASEGQGTGAVDFFSHSADYKDIVAEQAKRRKEKLAQEGEKKRRKEEERESKRRRISEEEEGFTGTGSRSGHSRDRSHTPQDSMSKSTSHTIPLSPAKSHRDPKSLSARYDSVEKTRVSPRKSTIIELSDPSDTDSEAEAIYKSIKPKPRAAHIPTLPSKPAPTEVPDDEVEEEEDPEFRALAAKARERRKAEEAAAAAKASSRPTSGLSNGIDDSKSSVPDPIVILLIESAIPETKPLLVKVKLSSTLEKPKKAWIDRQSFSKVMAESVFFTWREMIIWDYTTIARLGVTVNEHGIMTVKDDNNIYDDAEPPKIHLQAWTQELFDAAKKEQADARRHEKEPLREEEEEEVIEPPKPIEKRTRLILKARGMEDFRIAVKQVTTFSHLADAFRQARNVPPDKLFYLSFDGERLKPFDTIADSEIEDLDVVEVHFRE